MPCSKSFLCFAAVGLLSLAALARPASAATFCVGTVAELRSALMAAQAGVRVPKVVTAALGPEGDAFVVTRQPDIEPLEKLSPDEVSDEMLEAVWEQAARLRSSTHSLVSALQRTEERPMSVNDPLLSLSAVDLRRRIGSKEMSPVELTAACIERIERINPAVNAVTAVCYERAREEARAAEQAVMRGDALGMPSTHAPERASRRHPPGCATPRRPTPKAATATTRSSAAPATTSSPTRAATTS